jgi:hypothetical protein
VSHWQIVPAELASFEFPSHGHSEFASERTRWTHSVFARTLMMMTHSASQPRSDHWKNIDLLLALGGVSEIGCFCG